MRFAALAALTALAAQSPARPVRWTIHADGRDRSATLRATIDPGWKLYSMTQPPGGPGPTRISVAGDAPLRLGGRVQRPSPDTIPHAIFGIMSEVYEDSVSFHIPLAGVSGRRQQLVVTVTYQACTNRVCLTPRTDTLRVMLPTRR